METSVWKRKINIFLLGIPLVLFAKQIGLGDWIEAHSPVPSEPVLLALAALALLPLASFVESGVEELAELLGPFVGGFLHTTFSNVAELAIALSILLTVAAPTGPEIVLGSIAGVIIRNSLLFLGVATIAGCWKNGNMRFDVENAGEYATVFALAVIGLSLPTLAAVILASSEAPASGAEGAAHNAIASLTKPFEGGGGGVTIGGVQLGTALAYVFIVSYLAYVLFAVFKVRAAKEYGANPRHKRRRRRRNTFDPTLDLGVQPDTQALFGQEREQARTRLEEDERELHPRAQRARARRRAQAEARARAGKPETFFQRSKALRGVVAAIILATATVGVVAMSEEFAHAAEGLAKIPGVPDSFEFFLGLIVIPVIGGIVELYGSVESARERKMEIVMAVTAGATIQMILFVVPILAIVGFFTGHPLDLVFKPLEVIVFGAATFTFMLLSRDGESSILEGIQLVALWAMLAVIALLIPIPIG